MSKRQRRNNDPEQPKRSLFRRFDDLSMRIYGPAERSPRNLRGQEEPSEQTKQWYQDLQHDYVVEKDAHGRSYLRPRGPQDGPATTPENPQ